MFPGPAPTSHGFSNATVKTLTLAGLYGLMAQWHTAAGSFSLETGYTAIVVRRAQPVKVSRM